MTATQTAPAGPSGVAPRAPKSPSLLARVLEAPTIGSLIALVIAIAFFSIKSNAFLTGSISRKMHLYATDVGLLEIDGSYVFDHLALPDGFRLIETTAINTDRTANKVSYVSPKLGGWQLAGSLIPGSDDPRGDNVARYSRFREAFIATVKYSSPEFFAADVSAAGRCGGETCSTCAPTPARAGAGAQRAGSGSTSGLIRPGCTPGWGR